MIFNYSCVIIKLSEEFEDNNVEWRYASVEGCASVKVNIQRNNETLFPEQKRFVLNKFLQIQSGVFNIFKAS